MKQNWKFCLVVLCVLLASSGVVGCKKKTVATLPELKDTASWQKSGETRTYQAQDLWQYIDGDAEQYVQAGVTSTITADYKFAGGIEATADIFSMKTPEGASKILALSNTPQSKKMQIGDEGYVFSQSVSFRKGSALVRVVSFQNSPQTQAALITLAQKIESTIQ